MEVTIKAKPSRKSGWVRFYANTNLILSVEVEISSYVRLAEDFEGYCSLVRALGHTVEVGDFNLYSVFILSRSEIDWGEVSHYVPVLNLHNGDREFLKSLKIAVED